MVADSSVFMISSHGASVLSTTALTTRRQKQTASDSLSTKGFYLSSKLLSHLSALPESTRVSYNPSFTVARGIFFFKIF